MRKILKISALIMLSLLWACNPDDDTDEPSDSYRLDEYQSNWQKRKIADRPNWDVSGALPGQFTPVQSSFMYESNNKIVMYSNRYLYSPNSFIYTSTNYGLAWYQNSSINGTFINTCQIGEDTVYALRSYLGGTEFGKSVNAGQNWTWLAIPSDPYLISFANANKGISLCTDGIYSTLNGGSSWTKISSDTLSYAYALNETDFIGITGNEIHKSSDGGSSWTLKYTSGFELKTIYQSNEGVLYVGGYSGSVIRSFTNGDIWTQIFQLGQSYTGVQLAQLTDFCMVDSLNGFATVTFEYLTDMGSPYDNTIGLILRTPDAGETWTINYYSEIIQYNGIISVSGPIVLALGKQAEDNIWSGIYLTLTQTLGN